MKKVVLTSLATLGLALGAFGQGAIFIDNVNAAGYLNIGDDIATATHYTGPMYVEIWYKNDPATAADTAINSLNGIKGQAPAAYAMLTADGFTLATHINATDAAAKPASGGVLSGFDVLQIPGINRVGNAAGNTLFGVVFWTGNSPTLPGGVNGGVLTFNNPTSDYTLQPPPGAPAMDNWPVDLVMTPIPEPGTFALAGLGAAALLIFRRRK